MRNGSRSKTVISDAVGEVRIDVPRDREGTFEPQIVKKRQRRLGDVDEIVLSLYAKGLTTGEISAHFADIYGASVSKDTISRITDTVIAEMQDWAARPLDGVYVAVFIDAIQVKVRDGQVAPRPALAPDQHVLVTSGAELPPLTQSRETLVWTELQKLTTTTFLSAAAISRGSGCKRGRNGSRSERLMTRNMRRGAAHAFTSCSSESQKYAR